MPCNHLANFLSFSLPHVAIISITMTISQPSPSQSSWSWSSSNPIALTQSNKQCNPWPQDENVIPDSMAFCGEHRGQHQLGPPVIAGRPSLRSPVPSASQSRTLEASTSVVKHRVAFAQKATDQLLAPFSTIECVIGRSGVRQANPTSSKHVKVQVNMPKTAQASDYSDAVWGVDVHTHSQALSGLLGSASWLWENLAAIQFSLQTASQRHILHTISNKFPILMFLCCIYWYMLCSKHFLLYYGVFISPQHNTSLRRENQHWRTINLKRMTVSVGPNGYFPLPRGHEAPCRLGHFSMVFLASRSSIRASWEGSCAGSFLSDAFLACCLDMFCASFQSKNQMNHQNKQGESGWVWVISNSL